MKPTNLYLTVGIPGSGKSTWCEQAAKGTASRHISRDAIRFSFLEDGDSYFDKEYETFNEFVRQINDAIKDETVQNVYVDATHLSEGSRNKILNRLNLSNVRLFAVNFLTNFDIAKERNEKRKGLKCVPEDSLMSMYNGFRPVMGDEKYHYEIINIVTNKE